MEAVQDRQQVELVHDKDYEDDVGPYFGKYLKRNGIIHRGESATEDDARRAIEVARRVVEIMSAL